jgi:hypothetical protein
VAVERSRASRIQQDALSLDALVVTSAGGTQAALRYVGGKTFRLRDGVWTDTELKDDHRLPVTVLRFGSAEYHAAVRDDPALARYFSLGERVVVVHRGRVYRVETP